MASPDPYTLSSFSMVLGNQYFFKLTVSNVTKFAFEFQQTKRQLIAQKNQ